MSKYLPSTPVAPDSGRWKPVQRGYPTGTEVLTVDGWVELSTFFNKYYLADVLPFEGNGRADPGFEMKNLEWGQWKTNPSTFPLIGSVNPQTGQLVFVQPTVFMYYRYTGRLSHIKMKGIDFLCTSFTDLWVLPKYGRSWKFVLADDIIRNNYTSMNYGLLNKWSTELYGIFDPTPHLLSSTENSKNMEGVVESNIFVNLSAPIKLYPKKHASRKRVWDMFNYNSVDAEGHTVVADVLRSDIETFNMICEPHHNIVIRKARADDNPRTPWIGGAVVVGDGLDKSLLRINRVLGGGKNTVGGSYSVLQKTEPTLPSLPNSSTQPHDNEYSGEGITGGDIPYE